MDLAAAFRRVGDWFEQKGEWLEEAGFGEPGSSARALFSVRLLELIAQNRMTNDRLQQILLELANTRSEIITQGNAICQGLVKVQQEPIPFVVTVKSIAGNQIWSVSGLVLPGGRAKVYFDEGGGIGGKMEFQLHADKRLGFRSVYFGNQAVIENSEVSLVGGVYPYGLEVGNRASFEVQDMYLKREG
jgi:hypothetical protein